MNSKKTDEPQDLPVMISNTAWQSILPFLKASTSVYVGNPEDCRRFLSAIVWITKEGATWRALPKAYGYWNSIYRRFGRWCDAGVFEKLHEHFHEAGEISALLIDSTIVRAHSSAAAAPKKKTEVKTMRHSVEVEVALRRNSMLRCLPTFCRYVLP